MEYYQSSTAVSIAMFERLLGNGIKTYNSLLNFKKITLNISIKIIINYKVIRRRTVTSKVPVFVSIVMLNRFLVHCIFNCCKLSLKGTHKHLFVKLKTACFKFKKVTLNIHSKILINCTIIKQYQTELLLDQRHFLFPLFLSKDFLEMVFFAIVSCLRRRFENLFLQNLRAIFILF